MLQFIHDRRGATALEFALVLFSIILFIFGIFDLSRYALTWFSVSSLAGEAIRSQTICYSPLIAKQGQTVACPSDPFSADQKRAVAPALFWGSLNAPTVTTVPTDTTVSRPRVITVSVTGFKPVTSSLISYPDTLTVTVNLPF